MPKTSLATVPQEAIAALEAIGHQVRRARLARGDTQAQAAERLGAHVQTIARIEHGDPGVSGGHLLGLLAIYGAGPRLFELAEEDEQTRILAARKMPTRGRRAAGKAKVAKPNATGGSSSSGKS